MSYITKPIKKMNLVRFKKLSFISEYVIKVWFGIAASDQKNPSNVHESISFDALASCIIFLKMFAHKYK